MTIQQTHQATDIMHRRTALPMTGCFHRLDSTVTIRTNASIVLQAAVEAGLTEQAEQTEQTEQTETALLWEIVAEAWDKHANEPFAYRAIESAGTVYLDMGPRQWFAFDTETGCGAGFVVLFESAEETARNVAACLRAIAAHANRAPLKEESERRQK
jgi:hypothetical protein